MLIPGFDTCNFKIKLSFWREDGTIKRTNSFFVGTRKKTNSFNELKRIDGTRSF